MVSSNIIRNVIGIIGNILATFLFLSPMPTFVDIWKKKSVEQYSPMPYLATLVNCMVWILYGLPMVNPNSILVITINGIGTTLELTYVLLFIVFSDNKKRLKVVLSLLVGLIFVAIVALLVLNLAHSHKKRSLILGTLACCLNIIMYASPLSIMKLVITKKSVEYMPFLLSFASFINASAWIAYAIIRFDPFILTPNGMGSLLSLAQLILYCMYYKSTKRQIEARKNQGQVDLSQVVVNGNRNGNSKRTSINSGDGAPGTTPPRMGSNGHTGTTPLWTNARGASDALHSPLSKVTY
ncbi:Bidirectional sugar transporter SWEET4 [Euphorbia peplus]|nr:Bidirectional sugar transporter SWEET4 [Euphorbia peplus]